MIIKHFLPQHPFIRRSCLRQLTTKIDIEKLEKESAVSVDVLDDEAKQREEKIQQKRNKSRLRPQHRNIVLGRVPYEEPIIWIHNTVAYARKTYGRYGQASGVSPSLCWPTKQELADKIEYEKVAYPFTIQEMIEKAQKEKEEKQQRIMKRQEDIVKKMAKLDQWKKELHDKIAKKESEELAARERKERLIEEVRRHFGFTVDPRDERFKEMLEKKEKEQKKAMKEARRKVKEEKMIARLLSKKTDLLESSESKEDSKEQEELIERK